MYSLEEKETFFGTTNGGTTIQLPFGFVQWHQHQMQFHHNYYKIKILLGKQHYISKLFFYIDLTHQKIPSIYLSRSYIFEHRYYPRVLM